MGKAGTDERNRSSTERLRALARRLSDDELARSLDPRWTTSAIFAHIAFWDRFVLARWNLAVTEGSRAPDRIDDTPQDLINDAALPGWNAIPARAALEGCLAAAAELDRFIGTLDADLVVELVRDRRERLVDRSLHRGEHLDALEAAFPDQ
jgi:DinB superfamily